MRSDESKVSIREATEADTQDIMRMGRAFFARTAYADIGFDEESVLDLVAKLIGSPEGLLLIAENPHPVGMIGALRYPFYMNRHHITSQELFWWVDEDARASGAGLALVEALEQWVGSSGTHSLQMMCLESIEPERMSALYRRRRYRPAERTFMKVL